MINAIPNHQQPPTPTNPGTPPVPVAPPAATTAPSISSAPAIEAQPHGQVDNLPEKLNEKLGIDAPVTKPEPTIKPASDAVSQPPVSPNILMTSSPMGTDSSIPASKKQSTHGRRNTLVAALVLFLALAGGGAGYFLSQQDQDIRQQAASEEVTGTESSRTPAEWQAFSAGWQAVLSDEDASWKDLVVYSQSTGARYNCSDEIMRVGSEVLYGCDLNALFILYEPDVYISPAAIGPQDPALNRVLDGLITNSGLLQEASALGYITLDSTIFNSPQKDSIARILALKQLRDEIGTALDKTVDFEAVVIYFHNQVDPQIPLHEAKTAAKAKMDLLYERLQAGTITMEQAGNQIAADSIPGDTTGVSLADLDSVYKSNAYLNHVAHRFDSRFFKDETLDDELRSLGEGQMSTVKLCRDYKFSDSELLDSLKDGNDFSPPLVDSCYMIFKVNKINFGLVDQTSTKAAAEEFITESYQAKTTRKPENLQ